MPAAKATDHQAYTERHGKGTFPAQSSLFDCLMREYHFIFSRQARFLIHSRPLISQECEGGVQ